MSPLERLVDFFAAQYRWGLHPFKLVIALLAPVTVVWVADRRLRRLSEDVAADEERIRRLPRIRRR